MIQQRTLLPYRLRVQAAEREILEALAHHPEELALAIKHCDRVITRGPGWEHSLRALRPQLVAHGYLARSEEVAEERATMHLEELQESVAVLAMMEREWLCPHGFALIRRCDLPTLRGVA